MPVHLETSAGEELFTFAPQKNFAYLIYSFADLAKGNDQVYLGGSAIFSL